MKIIKKLKLHNFKRFKNFEIDFSQGLNVLIGPNEAGKSTIILAMELVLGAARSKLDLYGLEEVFNKDVISDFIKSQRKVEDLPILRAEIFFSELNDHEFNGKENSDRVLSDGIKLECVPNDYFGEDIQKALSGGSENFPFEYYQVKFETFAGKPFFGHKNPIKLVSIDTTSGNSEYATREYIKMMYDNSLAPKERARHHNEYRNSKEVYSRNFLKELNDRNPEYKFGTRNNAKSNLETDLTVYESGISIENKGKGKQCLIKTKFALSKKGDSNVIFMEEPENHLSHVNMREIIEVIASATEKQLITTTHSPMICSRLGLRNVLLISNVSPRPKNLKGINKEVSNFFTKAPDSNLLEFVLSEKVILVEGAAEYILMEFFVEQVLKSSANKLKIHIISVNGIGFKNYMHIARELNLKTVIIRDNDGNYQKNCIDLYDGHTGDLVKVFADQSNERYTFEYCLYEDNKKVCEDLFAASRRTITVLDYMLSEKAEVAFQLLDKKKAEIVAPSYIAEAIRWLNT